MNGSGEPPAVAIFPWGDPIEEFLGPIGLTLEQFADEMTGGWLFGYVAGLTLAGWRPVLVCVSEAVEAPVRLTHAGTGAPLWAVPPVRRGTAPCASPNRESLRRWRETPFADFARVLREERCRAILVQEYEYARFDALVGLGLRLRLPVYAAFQGGDVTASAVEAAVRPLSLRLASGLIVSSARERARIERRYGLAAGKVAAVPNPLDLEEWRPGDRWTARAELGLPYDGFVVVSHGRIDLHRKGLDVLVDAWRRFAADRPDAHLALIGSGQDDAALAELLETAAPRNLTWVRDYVTDRAYVRRWLSAADAYVIASRTEGLPVAPLEAMACGAPVIATDAHGLPDIFEHGRGSGALMVPRGDVVRLADAFAEMEADPALRADLRAAARRRVGAYATPVVGQALAGVLSRGGRASV